MAQRRRRLFPLGNGSRRFEETHCIPVSPRAQLHGPQSQKAAASTRFGDMLAVAVQRVQAATPPPRTEWTRRVPPPVLIGHAASLPPY